MERSFVILLLLAVSGSFAKSEIGFIRSVYCMEDKIVYTNDNLANKEVTGTDQCYDLCKEHKCTFWSMSKGSAPQECSVFGPDAERHKCTFWSIAQGPSPQECSVVGPKVTRKSHQGYVSGDSRCRTASGFSVIQDFVRYHGDNIGMFSVETTDECHKFCVHTKACAFWTVVKDTGVCYLHGSTAMSEPAIFNFVSGEMNRSTRSVYCIEDKVNYKEDHLASKAVVGTDQCHIFCKEHNKCAYWSIAKGPGFQSCAVYGSTATRQVDPAFVSGAMSCSTPSGKSVIQEMIMYNGTDIGSFSVTNNDECHKFCIHTKACASWTVAKDTRVCYLHNLNATKVATTNDFVSGVISRKSNKLIVVVQCIAM